MSGGLFHTTDDSSWAQPTYSQQVVQDEPAPTFTAFDSSWA